MDLILGTITFGQQTLDEEASVMVKTALKNGIQEIDTAYVYNEGECERILGRVLAPFDRKSYRLATKVNPRITGKLDRPAILAQFTESLVRLGTDYADILYLHFPDRLVPLEEALSTCNELYDQGRIRELGVSNYPADMVEEACKLCEANGWIKPAVYEGVYNVLSRNAEGELFDMIRRHELRFTAYNPLAGGMLTGKYSAPDDFPSDGRFAQRESYKKRYWRQSFFDAVDSLRGVCAQYDLSLIEAALRWIAYHSAMDSRKGDAIIVGSSKPDQLIQNIGAVSGGPLPEEVAAVCDKAWNICRGDAPNYYTFMN